MLAVPGTLNFLSVSAPPSVETGHSAHADGAEDGRRGFAAAAAPPPEARSPASTLAVPQPTVPEANAKE